MWFQSQNLRNRSTKNVKYKQLEFLFKTLSRTLTFSLNGNSVYKKKVIPLYKADCITDPAATRPTPSAPSELSIRAMI